MTEIDSTLLSKTELGKRLPTEEQVRAIATFFTGSPDDMEAKRIAEKFIREHKDSPRYAKSRIVNRKGWPSSIATKYFRRNYSDTDLGRKGRAQDGRFDFIVSNPPFGSTVKQTEKACLHYYRLATRDVDWLNPKSKAAARASRSVSRRC